MLTCYFIGGFGKQLVGRLQKIGYTIILLMGQNPRVAPEMMIIPLFIGF